MFISEDQKQYVISMIRDGFNNADILRCLKSPVTTREDLVVLRKQLKDNTTSVKIHYLQGKLGDCVHCLSLKQTYRRCKYCNQSVCKHHDKYHLRKTHAAGNHC